MEFVTETKPTYTIIYADGGVLTTELAEALKLKMEEQKVAGCLSFIVNLKKLTDIETVAGNILMDIHNYIYDGDGSLVFAESPDNVLQKLKKEQFHLSLNLCPTMAEAVDILSMELLERDLLKE